MNVLLATDGKPHSDRAVNYAIEYAERFDANLFIIFVVGSRQGEDRDGMIKYGMAVLEDVKQKVLEKKVAVTTLLEAGSPHEATLAVSERVKADAIIVGTSGKSTIDRALLGSVSEFVVRNAKCTVIVVR
ncbi:MAG TPA: universal stress protein [Methanocella sp.]|nr:universal stress protein [Methanocella sp.]